MDNKISIIIPAYNIEQYLGATLDSVLAQTHANIEIVVVNDGSMDGTGALIDQYAAKDNRIKAIHKENGDVPSARLRGVAEATGEWIGFVDGDDYVEPEMFTHLLKNAVEYGADISHCGHQMVFPDGHIDYYYNTGRLVKQDRATGLKDLLSGSFIEPGLWNKLFHKTLFHSLLHAEQMPTSIKINEDLLMNYYLFKASNVSVYEDFCPYHYVLRKGSAATSKLNANKLWDPLKVLRIIMEDAPDEVKPAIIPRLIRLLISGATMSLGDQRELILPYRTETRRELRKRLRSVLFGNECGLKLKAMALWAAAWPGSYGWVHRTYARVTGIDKKYDL